MKAFPRVLLAALLAVSPLAADAAKPQKKKAAPPAQAPASSPAAALEPYINNVDTLLALQRPAPKNAKIPYAQVTGRIPVLRQQFITERDQAAEADKAKFAAAIETCDAITAALDERQKVLGDLAASSSVRGSSKLAAGPRKDNLTQGIEGGDRAKAVGAVVERDRERAAARAAKKQAAAGDDALTAMSENRWNKRSIELRQKIVAAYAGIK